MEFLRSGCPPQATNMLYFFDTFGVARQSMTFPIGNRSGKRTARKKIIVLPHSSIIDFCPVDIHPRARRTWGIDGIKWIVGIAREAKYDGVVVQPEPFRAAEVYCKLRLQMSDVHSWANENGFENLMELENLNLPAGVTIPYTWGRYVDVPGKVEYGMFV